MAKITRYDQRSSSSGSSSSFRSSNGDRETTQKKVASSRRKVKTGCRTCKIRRVKCDEGRPSCNRCFSTGRTCDGYGIFGGGGKPTSGDFMMSKKRSAVGVGYSPKNTPEFWSVSSTTEEKSYFEWFRLQTSKKVPGIFASSFWDQLILQATANDPAVLHAVLALSSIQKREVFFGKDSRDVQVNLLDSQESFMLRQYTKAIAKLQPHFSTKDRSSIRIALVTCVVFICLEYLQGHYRTAQTHFKNGLKLLNEIKVTDLIDQCILEEFTKLNVQVELLRLGYRHSCSVVQSTGTQLSQGTFHSTREARQNMDQILDQIFRLTEEVRKQGLENSPTPSTDQVDRQTLILTRLSGWLHTFHASKTKLQTPTLAHDKLMQAQVTMRDNFAYRVLRIWYVFATVMTSVAIWPGCEVKFDDHTSDFVSIIAQMIDLRAIVPATQKALYDTGNETTHSIFHIGLMPALYYTAIKCRVHRIRLQAVRLLEATSHREGLWDAKVFACAARKVMEVEERGFYADFADFDDFSIFEVPEQKDLDTPTLPDTYRVHEVEVVLPDSSTEGLQLVCRRRRDDGGWDTLNSKFDLTNHVWQDNYGWTDAS
ncbi:Zn2/Cys6 DNA-binding protein [Glarea lozoyensis ATCC 20868]|uniref:Zn2/Cys6 DNA-binding protein n=1 Tax=Glarea lozoyensis (strain ATCC 20868 / MF5171) TaxID=1116229 RepID=S3CU54_GLAL2|nr:Zn2/Cys6 DNA-binding protein [Glarea lozoyensis ATCC 20868]EPE29942.1 Zn2/Cys6 DNA-binding protein [Glarea lozoyensis ATCC 20868]